MQARQKPEFETPDRRRIYEYVERHGLVEREGVAEALEMDPDQFDHELAMLKRDAYLEEYDGALYVALEAGTAEEYHRHGIGSHFLHRSLEWAAAQGYRKVYNSIPATNQEAARFLEEHGFETEAIRKDHYLIDDEFVAELMMAKTL